MKYYTMEHRGTLFDALLTKIEITKLEFEKLLPMYEYYCYDNRINCDRYLLINMEINYIKYPTWLLIERY